ncbi:uncharacterized protein [Clytia hemisphaerica]|uniref:uncharacterized protein n=1 Tax=Clytia hemisphaerica TaxID=252671 RepID=UPI0034D7130A
MPGSFMEARSLLKPFLVPLEKYDVCVNDCVIFRNEYSFSQECPVCEEKRYEDGKPRRTFTYFPLGPRLARIAGSNILEKPEECRGTDDEWIKDIHDTIKWKEWHSQDGMLHGKIGIATSFCTDGVNPLKSNNRSYSMWPLMLQILNWPPKFRKSFAGIQLLGIAPGNGTKEPKNLEPYL